MTKVRVIVLMLVSLVVGVILGGLLIFRQPASFIPCLE